MLDKLTYAGNLESLRNLPTDRLAFIEGDIADAGLVDGLVADCDVVVHYAAESHNDNSLHDPRPSLDTNIIGTYTLIEAARKHNKRFHHISTDEVYGDLELDDPERFTEQPVLVHEGRFGPVGPRLGAFLRAAGHHQQLLKQLWPVPARGEIIPRQITNVIDGIRPRVYGKGENVRDWIHANDHSSAVLAIIAKGRIGETGTAPGLLDS